MTIKVIKRASGASRRDALKWTMGAASLVVTGCSILPTAAQERAAPEVGKASRLKSPFPERVANPRPAKALKACEAPPPAVTKLVGISKYDKKDPTKSKIDPEAESRLRAETAPLADFTRKVVNLSDAVAGDPAGTRPHAECAWKWLDSWAAKNALEGNNIDEAQRKWELAALSCAVLKLQHWSPESSSGHRPTLEWLRRLGNYVVADYSKNPSRGSRRSNHRYWAAWAATATAVATNDGDLFQWGMTGYQIGIDEIQDDGSLPLEVARGTRALGYHNFSLIPLVMMAETGEANGQPMYAMKKNRLSLLIQYALENFENPSRIARAAGAEQNMDEAIKPGNIVWLEPWYARSRDPRAERWLSENRPLVQRGAGGDLTMLFGAPLPEAAG